MSSILNLIFPNLEPTLEQAPMPVATAPVPWAIRLINARIPAGVPRDFSDTGASEIDLNELMVERPSATFMFTVSGESMRDLGILNGDIIIADKSKEPCHGNVVIAVINREFTIKRLFMKDSRIGLIPANKAFKPIWLQGENDLKIFGVVTGMVRKF